MPIGVINSKMRDKKDHFVITLYRDIRNKLDIVRSSIILFRINENEFIRIPNVDFHVTIPKKFIKEKKVNIEIMKIWDKDKAKKRQFRIFNNKKLNLSS